MSNETSPNLKDYAVVELIYNSKFSSSYFAPNEVLLKYKG